MTKKEFNKLIADNSGAGGLTKLEEIRRQYRESPLELAAYNLEDCRLVAEIFEKADLFDFSILGLYLVCGNSKPYFSDAFLMGSIGGWEGFLFSV